jgi:hypothetical protein
MATNFEVDGALPESQYANAFYTIVSGNDLTIVFYKTKTLNAGELADANAANVMHVTPVSSIVLARSTADSLGKQILEQLNLPVPGAQQP